MRYPPGTSLFPSRDEFAAYLEACAERLAVEIRLGVRVERIDGGDGRWTVRATDGDLAADEVIVATGYASEPVVPDWPGLERSASTGSCCTRPTIAIPSRSPAGGCWWWAPDPRGWRSRTSSSMRAPRRCGWRSARRRTSCCARWRVSRETRSPWRSRDCRHGLRTLRIAWCEGSCLATSRGTAFHSLQRGPSHDPDALERPPRGRRPAVLRAIVGGRIDIVGAVERFERTAVVLAGGRRLEPDAVIAATGSRCGLKSLVAHLWVLDPRGVPNAVGGQEAAPGLRFIGFSPGPGLIRRVSVESERAARGIARG